MSECCPGDVCLLEAACHQWWCCRRCLPSLSLTTFLFCLLGSLRAGGVGGLPRSYSYVTTDCRLV